jgi:hypothetical protein
VSRWATNDLLRRRKRLRWAFSIFRLLQIALYDEAYAATRDVCW